MNQLQKRAQETAIQAVRRACYTATDSDGLRREIGVRLAQAVPVDAHGVCSTDPSLWLLTGAATHGMTANQVHTYISVVYPFEEATTIMDMARSNQTVSQHRSHFYDELLGPERLGARLLAVFKSGDSLFGWSCLLRESGAAPFQATGVQALRRLAPHLTRALKRAAQLDAHADPGCHANPGDVTSGLSDAPSVILVDGHGEITLRDSRAAGALADLAGAAEGTGKHLPPPVAGALAQLYARHRSASLLEPPLEGLLRARGRSGRWYEISATLSEPDASGASVAVLVIVPERRVDPGARLAHYALSPRERDIVCRVARGESTKAIARALGISPYTVQEHIGNASDKIGVRGRRALVAKLFMDSCGAAANGSG